MSTAFRITMTGAEQVPVVMTTASGLGVAIFDSTTTSLSFTINMTGVDWGPILGLTPQTAGTGDDVNGEHFHSGDRGVNGPVVFDWKFNDLDDFTATLEADGSWTIRGNWETTDSGTSISTFASALANATLGSDVALYANVHTNNNGGGEIRGQLVTIATDAGETVNGTSGNDILPGLGGDDTINGGIGNDTIDGGTGTDTMTGGTGNDTYFVDNVGDVVSENAGEGNDIVNSTVAYALAANVDSLVLLGTANIDGAGNGDANALIGNSGNNALDGLGGNDFMQGGVGDDVYVIDSTSDFIQENAGEGNDVVHTTVDYTIGANLESVILDGTGNINAVGNADPNALVGNSGNNTLDGAGGDDVMIGGAGNDIYFIDSTSDVIQENSGEGNDIVHASVDYTIGPNVESVILDGTDNINAVGSADPNALVGNSGNNTLDGSGGDDIMIGGAGNDIYFVDSTSDVIQENSGEGNDIVHATVDFTIGANVESVILDGGGNINAAGSADANAIVGNSGNNVLDGKGAQDLLTGNAGDDTFFFAAGEAAGDVVVDFAGNGALAGDSFQFSGFGTTAGGASFTQIGATNQWRIHSGLDGHDEDITLQNGAAVDASDFVFV